MNFWLGLGALQLQNEENNRNLRRERIFRDRNNPLDIPDEEIFQHYRFPRNVVVDIIDILCPLLQHPTKRSHAIPVEIQACSALRFYATDSFFQVIGDLFGISKSAVSLSVTNVSEVLTQQSHRYITFPKSNADRHSTMQAFYEIAGMPQVLGAIDCTHVNIIRPTEGENQYVNRKGKHSINVQAVCDASMKFTDVVARFPGSAHDAFIWENCGLHDHMVDSADDAYLIGDSAYPLRTYLLKVYDNPTTDIHRRFNRKIKKTRVLIECAFGIFKSRFRCLDNSGGHLLMRPERVCNMVMACMVLHNIAIQRGIPAPPMEPLADNDNDDIDQDFGVDAINAGRLKRDEVVHVLVN